MIPKMSEKGFPSALNDFLLSIIAGESQLDVLKGELGICLEKSDNIFQKVNLKQPNRVCLQDLQTLLKQCGVEMDPQGFTTLQKYFGFDIQNSIDQAIFKQGLSSKDFRNQKIQGDFTKTTQEILVQIMQTICVHYPIIQNKRSLLAFQDTEIISYFKTHYKDTQANKDTLKQMLMDCGIYNRVNNKYLISYLLGNKSQLKWNCIFKLPIKDKQQHSKSNQQKQIIEQHQIAPQKQMTTSLDQDKKQLVLHSTTQSYQIQNNHIPTKYGNSKQKNNAAEVMCQIDNIEKLLLQKKHRYHNKKEQIEQQQQKRKIIVGKFMKQSDRQQTQNQVKSKGNQYLKLKGTEVMKNRAILSEQSQKQNINGKIISQGLPEESYHKNSIHYKTIQKNQNKQQLQTHQSLSKGQKIDYMRRVQSQIRLPISGIRVRQHDQMMSIRRPISSLGIKQSYPHIEKRTIMQNFSLLKRDYVIDIADRNSCNRPRFDYFSRLNSGHKGLSNRSTLSLVRHGY